MSEERALTWSRKWHIINPHHPDAKRYAIARCGAYCYRNDDPRYPRHLKEVLDGQKKDTGLCKVCTKTKTNKAMTEDQARAIANSVGMEHNLVALEEFGWAILTAYGVLYAAEKRRS
jgi:hypothetical protein